MSYFYQNNPQEIVKLYYRNITVREFQYFQYLYLKDNDRYTH